MVSVSFVITCKGRLHHIKETLPSLFEQSADKIIVVDYGCPDKAGDWVEENYPKVKVVRITDDPGFCLARARNKGAEVSTSEWLCFMDADVLAKPGFVSWMKKTLNDPGCFYRASSIDGERIPDTRGTVILSRKAYDHLGGYDEAFRGWGLDDDDLYDRLKEEGYIELEYPRAYVDGIPHDDSERVAFYDIKDIHKNWKLNCVYKDIKHIIEDKRHERLPEDLRKDIIDQLTPQIYNKKAHRLKLNGTVFSIRLQSSNTGKLSDVYRFKMKRRYRLFGPNKLCLI